MSSGPKRFYHGTRADLKPGELIAVGRSSNYDTRKTGVLGLSHRHAGRRHRGAELAVGEGRERFYIVEPRADRGRPQPDRQKIPWKSDAVPPLPRAAPGYGRGQGLGRPLSRAAEGNEGPSPTLEGTRRRGD